MGDQRGREKNVKPLFRPDVSQDGRKVGLTEEKLYSFPVLLIGSQSCTQRLGKGVNPKPLQYSAVQIS